VVNRSSIVAPTFASFAPGPDSFFGMTISASTFEKLALVRRQRPVAFVQASSSVFTRGSRGQPLFDSRF